MNGSSKTVDLISVDLQARVAEEDARRRSDQMAATAQMAACMAHEVNNPAAYVTANLNTLAAHLAQLEEMLCGYATGALPPGLDERRARSLIAEAQDIVRDNLHGMGRITSIVRGLKEFSEIDAEHIELVNLNEIVNSACSIANNQVRHRARLIKALGDVPSIAGDPNRLRQVVLNLLLNAAEAIEEGAADRHFVEIRTVGRNGQVIVSVRDSGPGITDDVQTQIFQPFFSTKGTPGLGLAVCADVARLHGGSIHVVSQVGRGSRFDLLLPEVTGLEIGAPVKKRASAPPSQDMSANGARVLLIDDEVMLLEAYRRMLAPFYDVVTAPGGAEALEILRYDPAFDAVICDLMMPQVDGPMIHQALQQLVPDLIPRVIFCSGGAFTLRARQFAASVPNPVLEKPVAAEDLRAAIAQVSASVELAAGLEVLGGDHQPGGDLVPSGGGRLADHREPEG